MNSSYPNPYAYVTYSRLWSPVSKDSQKMADFSVARQKNTMRALFGAYAPCAGVYGGADRVVGVGARFSVFKIFVR